MSLYLIIDEVTKKVVVICDDRDNAQQMIDNFIKTQQYRMLRIREMPLNTDKILPLGAVKARGRLFNGDLVKLSIGALNLSTTVNDSLIFTVNDRNETWCEAVVNLTADEIADEYLGDVKDRITKWVVSEYKTRLENDNI